MKYMLKQYDNKLFELIGQCERGKNAGEFYEQGRKYSHKGICSRLNDLPKGDEVDFDGIELIAKKLQGD